MLRTTLLLFVSIATAFGVAHGEPTDVAGSGIGHWIGHWERVDLARDDAARTAEIDRVTEPMSFVFRGFARAVMRRRMVPADRYSIALEDGVATIRTNVAGEVYPLDGKARGGSEADEVVSQFVGHGIRQVWRLGEESHGTTRWRLHEDGSRVTVTEEVNDPHFDAPIVFATTYRRVSPD